MLMSDVIRFLDHAKYVSYCIEEVITSLIWCSCMTQLLSISVANSLKEVNVKRGSVRVESATIWTITVASRVWRC